MYLVARKDENTNTIKEVANQHIYIEIVYLINYPVHLINYTLHIINYTLHLIYYTVHFINYTVHFINYLVYLINYTAHLIYVHGLSKMRPPEEQGVLQREAGSLKEEAVLHATSVLEVVGGAQVVMQATHAQGERSAHIVICIIDYFNRLWDCPEGGSSNLGPGSGVYCGP